MPVQPLPQQMTQNMLNPVKGWPSPTALDFRAKISPNVLYPMVAGQVAHLNAAGQLEPGVQGQQMGLFLFSNAGDPSANTAFPSNYQWVPITPSGNLTLLVAQGAYELETTEFDPTQTYVTGGQMLRSQPGNNANQYGSPTWSGALTNQAMTVLTNAACGNVSRGVFTNSYSAKVLAFWPVFSPVPTLA